MFRVKSKIFFYRMQNYIIFVAWLSFVSGCSKPYSDSQLIELLSENKAQFEELVSLSKQCMKDGSTIFWVREVDDKSSPCNSLMEAVDVQGFSIRENDTIMFHIEDGNYRSHQKGLAFSKIQLAPVFDSLDEKPSSIESYEEGYKKIDANWYITYQFVN